MKLLYSPGQTPVLRGQAHHPDNSDLTSSGQDIAEVDNFWTQPLAVYSGIVVSVASSQIQAVSASMAG